MKTFIVILLSLSALFAHAQMPQPWSPPTKKCPLGTVYYETLDFGELIIEGGCIAFNDTANYKKEIKKILCEYSNGQGSGSASMDKQGRIKTFYSESCSCKWDDATGTATHSMHYRKSQNGKSIEITEAEYNKGTGMKCLNEIEIN